MAAKRYWVNIPDVEYFRQMIKCQAACPVMTDARGYVTALARGELALGYQIAHDPNPLSTICGRICGAPCEEACRRSAIGQDHEPVAIRSLKRVLTERYGPETEGSPNEDFKPLGPGHSLSTVDFGLEPENFIPLPVRPTYPGQGATLSVLPGALVSERLRSISCHARTEYRTRGGSRRRADKPDGGERPGPVRA